MYTIAIKGYDRYTFKQHVLLKHTVNRQTSRDAEDLLKRSTAEADAIRAIAVSLSEVLDSLSELGQEKNVWEDDSPVVV